MVLETLHHNSLFAKVAKCAFCRSSVAFLGHVISAAGVTVDLRKTEAIREWPRPASCTNVRHFMGLANYYHKFVKGFATVAAQLQPKGFFQLGPGRTGQLGSAQRGPHHGSGSVRV